MCAVAYHQQLFLEEERERELEQLYETGLVESMNRSDEAVGSGVPDVDGTAEQQAEATSVSKQTTETLMSGERVMEALDIADSERIAQAEFLEAKAKLAPSEADKLSPPSKNAVLAAYQMEPDEYVLNVVEKINGTALLDALLVLPFGKVVSLMVYLNEWAKKVSTTGTPTNDCKSNFRILEPKYNPGFSHSGIPIEDSSSSNCYPQSFANIVNSPTKTPP